MNRMVLLYKDSVGLVPWFEQCDQVKQFRYAMMALTFFVNHHIHDYYSTYIRMLQVNTFDIVPMN